MNNYKNIKSKQIVVYFNNGNMITIKDKEPFKLTGTGSQIIFENSSYYYAFTNEAIAGMGFKFLSDEAEDTDDGK